MNNTAEKIAGFLNKEMEFQIGTSEHPYDETVTANDGDIEDPAIYNRYSVDFSKSLYKEKLVIVDTLTDKEDYALEKAVSGRLNDIWQIADERHGELEEEEYDRKCMQAQYSEMDKMFL